MFNYDRLQKLDLKDTLVLNLVAQQLEYKAKIPYNRENSCSEP